MGLSAVAAIGMAVMGKNQMDAQASARDQQNQAMQQAQQNATKQADMADQANNAASRKTPNIQGMIQGNKDGGMGGASSTLLTGMGANKDLTLGKSTLLGG
jgi:hypothetical protein